MIEWPTVKLGDVADFLTGFPFKSVSYSDAGSDPRLLRGDNIAQGTLRWDNAKRWPLTLTDDVSPYRLERGDVVLAMDRPWIDAGLKYATVMPHDLPSFLVQRVARLRGTRHLSARFLRYVIGSRAFTDYILGVQTGTAVPHISGSQIKGYQFRLPPIPEQEQIAEILGSLDDKIELNRRMNETLEAMAQAIFRDWFVDFGPTRRKIERATDPIEIMGGLVSDFDRARQLADLFPQYLGNDGLPEGWTEKPISQLAEITKGRSYKSSDLAQSETALVTLKSFRRGGGYREGGLKPYTGDFKPSQIVHPGEIVIAQTDVTQAAEIIGRPAIVDGDDAFSVLVASLDVAIVRPQHSANYTREFLFQTLASVQFTQHALAHVTGTTVLHLAKNALPDFQALVPSDEAVVSFSELIAPMMRRSEICRRENRALAATRDHLLPKLMAGEVRLRDAEAQLEAAQ